MRLKFKHIKGLNRESCVRLPSQYFTHTYALSPCAHHVALTLAWSHRKYSDGHRWTLRALSEAVSTHWGVTYSEDYLRAQLSTLEALGIVVKGFLSRFRTYGLHLSGKVKTLKMLRLTQVFNMPVDEKPTVHALRLWVTLCSKKRAHVGINHLYSMLRVGRATLRAARDWLQNVEFIRGWTPYLPSAPPVTEPHWQGGLRGFSVETSCVQESLASRARTRARLSSKVLSVVDDHLEVLKSAVFELRTSSDPREELGGGGQQGKAGLQVKISDSLVAEVEDEAHRVVEVPNAFCDDKRDMCSFESFASLSPVTAQESRATLPPRSTPDSELQLGTEFENDTCPCLESDDIDCGTCALQGWSCPEL